ncbi:MAG: phosphatidate cytidylyltransferase [Paludibacter sp.]
MNNFIKRTLSGSIFVLIIVGSILINQYAFAAVFITICALTMFEFHKITNSQTDVNVNNYISIVGGILLFICSFLYKSKILPITVFILYGLYFIIVLISELYRQKSNPIHNWAYFIMGQTFIAIPFSMLNFILYVHDYQPLILLSVFVTIWVNDTGAYLTGVSFGKHRLFERISPKKSWEGFVGGAVLALLSGNIFSRVIPEISLTNWFIFSEIIVIFGTFGDLIESLTKRTVGVKDSGNIIPGHGGLMDRFDSMLLATPAALMYLYLVY